MDNFHSPKHYRKYYFETFLKSLKPNTTYIDWLNKGSMVNANCKLLMFQKHFEDSEYMYTPLPIFQKSFKLGISYTIIIINYYYYYYYYYY